MPKYVKYPKQSLHNAPLSLRLEKKILLNKEIKIWDATVTLENEGEKYGFTKLSDGIYAISTDSSRSGVNLRSIFKKVLAELSFDPVVVPELKPKKPKKKRMKKKRGISL